jgi:hypothetical protein
MKVCKTDRVKVDRVKVDSVEVQVVTITITANIYPTGSI